MSDRPYVSFAEVKERLPLPDVLKVFGLVDQFTRKGDRLTGVCPLPAHQHGPRPPAREGDFVDVHASPDGANLVCALQPR